MKLQPRVSWNIDPAYYNLIKNTLYTPSKTCTYRSKSTHLSLFATKNHWNAMRHTMKKQKTRWMATKPAQTILPPPLPYQKRQTAQDSALPMSMTPLKISTSLRVLESPRLPKKGAPKVSQKLPLWLDIVFRGVLCLWWKSTKTKFCRETTCQPTSIPEDPITETENGFMEPKYLSFWRWLYTPCSSSDKVIGSLPVGHHTKLFWIQLPTSEGKCHMSPQQM